MGKVFNRLREQVERGMQGYNTGIPTGLPKMDLHTTGIQKGDYILCGAETNVGKTKFIRNNFVYNPYQYWLKHQGEFDIEFIDFSLEMTMEENLADLIAKDLYYDHNLVVPRSLLISRGFDETGTRRLLSEEVYQLFLSYEEKYSAFEEKLFIIDGDVTPTKFHDALFMYAKARGTFSNPTAKYISEAGEYTPNNPKLVTVIVFDTINLADEETGQTIKQTIDRISRICVWFKNKCQFTPVVIQQFNAEISGTDRSRYGIKTPLLRDFEDSKRTTKDASVVLALFDPTRHEMDTCIGYLVPEWKQYLRTLHLLKNRNGEMNKSVGLQFLGAVGIFRELPKAEYFEQNPDDVQEYTKYFSRKKLW